MRSRETMSKPGMEQTFSPDTKGVDDGSASWGTQANHLLVTTASDQERRNKLRGERRAMM